MSNNQVIYLLFSHHLFILKFHARSAGTNRANFVHNSSQNARDKLINDRKTHTAGPHLLSAGNETTSACLYKIKHLDHYRCITHNWSKQL